MVWQDWYHSLVGQPSGRESPQTSQYQGWFEDSRENNINAHAVIPHLCHWVTEGLLHVTSVVSIRPMVWGLFHKCFASSPKYSLEIYVVQKSHFLWAFQAETLFVCPKPCFGTRTKFQLEILTINVITGIVYFREIILESSLNVSETTPRILCTCSSNMTSNTLARTCHTCMESQIGL